MVIRCPPLGVVLLRRGPLRISPSEFTTLFLPSLRQHLQGNRVSSLLIFHNPSHSSDNRAACTSAKGKSTGETGMVHSRSVSYPGHLWVSSDNISLIFSSLSWLILQFCTIFYHSLHVLTIIKLNFNFYFVTVMVSRENEHNVWE